MSIRKREARSAATILWAWGRLCTISEFMLVISVNIDLDMETISVIQLLMDTSTIFRI